MILSYKYRLYPNRAQRDELTSMLAAFCDLYNAGLQQRIEAYRRQGKTLSYFDQTAELKNVRAEVPELGEYSYTAEQRVLRRLDKAYKALFRRGYGFPRFRSKSRYHAADFCVGDGLSLRKSSKIRITGIPSEIKVKWHRALPSKPKSAILTRQNGRWYIIFHVEFAVATVAIGRTVGIDVGLVQLASLSNGETIERPRWTDRASQGQRQRQRALARAKRGSKRWALAKARLARYSERIANRRRDHLHKVSAALAACYAGIAVEDLDLAKRAPSRRMRRDIYDAAWGQLIAMLDYKAEKAGGQVIKVDPRGTSERCSECGSDNHKMTARRMHKCTDCGFVLDRDVNAARNIYQLAYGPGTGPRTPSQRVAA